MKATFEQLGVVRQRMFAKQRRTKQEATDARSHDLGGGSAEIGEGTLVVWQVQREPKGTSGCTHSSAFIFSLDPFQAGLFWEERLVKGGQP